MLKIYHFNPTDLGVCDIIKKYIPKNEKYTLIEYYKTEYVFVNENKGRTALINDGKLSLSVSSELVKNNNSNKYKKIHI